MVLNPVATFFVYMGGIGLTFTVCAAVADAWAAKAERDARRQARAEARAKRKIGERSSDVHGH